MQIASGRIGEAGELRGFGHGPKKRQHSIMQFACTMLLANGVYALTGAGRHTDKHLEPISSHYKALQHESSGKIILSRSADGRVLRRTGQRERAMMAVDCN